MNTTTIEQADDFEIFRRLDEIDGELQDFHISAHKSDLLYEEQKLLKAELKKKREYKKINHTRKEKENMAWYAELKRKHWYCINQWDAIAWYREYLYNTWYSSLTGEQKEKLAETKRLEKEKRDKELQESFMRLGIMMSTVLSRAYDSRNHQKYHGLYDEDGNINHDFFKK